MKQLRRRCRSARRAADEPTKRFRVWREARRGFVTWLCAVALLATSLLLATTPLRAQYDSYPDAEWIDGGGLSPQRGAVWTPDERFVISATAVGDLIVWNAATHHLVRYLRRNLGAITSMDVSWTHDLLAIGTGSGDILEVSATTGQDVRVLHGHQSAVVDVKFSADERYLVSAGYGDLRVVLWDAASGDSLATLTGNKSYINDVAISADGHYVATAGADFTARVWDTRTGEQIYEFIWGLRAVGAVAFSQDGRYLAAISDAVDALPGAPPSFSLFSLDSGTVSKTAGGFAQTRDMAVSPDGRFLAIAGRAGGLSLIEFDNGDSLVQRGATGVGTSLNSVRFTADGSGAVVPDENGQLYTLRFGDDHTSIHIGASQLTSNDSPIRSFAMGPGDTTVATGTASGRVALWSTDDGGLKSTVVPSGYEVRSTTFSPDGRTLAICKMDGAVKLYDVLSTHLVRTLYGSANYSVNDAAWSPDGHRIVGALGPEDSTAVGWDTASQLPDQRFVGHRGGLWSVVWTPDGKYIITSGDDGTVRFWGPDATPIAVAEGHHGRINTLALSHDGAVVASAGVDRTIRLWRVPSGDPLGVLRGHTASVVDIAFLPDDRSIVSASSDGTIRVWSVASLVETNRYDSYPYPPVGIGIGPDGRSLLSAMADGSIVRWQLRTIADTPMHFAGQSAPVVVRPNPVRTSAQFTIELPHASDVLAQITDELGRVVATLVDGSMAAGSKHLRWNRGDLPSGAYFLTIDIGETRRVIPFVCR